MAGTRYRLGDCSILIPSEGWQLDEDSDPAQGPLVFRPQANPEVSLTLVVYELTITDEAQALLAEDYGFSDWQPGPAIPGGGNAYAAQAQIDSTSYDALIVEKGPDSIVIVSQYPSETAEGFGSRLSQLATTLTAE